MPAPHVLGMGAQIGARLVEAVMRAGTADAEGPWRRAIIVSPEQIVAY
jgi:hypothetical protein